MKTSIKLLAAFVAFAGFSRPGASLASEPAPKNADGGERFRLSSLPARNTGGPIAPRGISFSSIMARRDSGAGRPAGRVKPPAEPVVKFAPVPVAEGRRLVNAAALYPRAVREAEALVQAVHSDKHGARLAWVEGDMPMNGKEEMTFVFHPVDESGVKAGGLVRVNFSKNRSMSGTSLMKAYHVPGLEAAVDTPFFLSMNEPALFAKASALSPEEARGAARRGVVDFGHRARFIMGWSADPATGKLDLTYRLDDRHGHSASVNARTGALRVLAGSPKTGWRPFWDRTAARLRGLLGGGF